MTDLDRFIDGAISGPAAVARCEAVITRLEAEIAHLSAVNRILVDKLEWFSAYVGPNPRPIVEAPRVSPWPPRKEFVFVGAQVFCCGCGSPFERITRRKSLCPSCRSRVIIEGMAKKRAALEERIA